MNLLEWGDRRLLPLLFATIIPALVSGRILHHLHQHQRQGSRLPSETENFLLELAIMIRRCGPPR